MGISRELMEKLMQGYRLAAAGNKRLEENSWPTGMRPEPSERSGERPSERPGELAGGPEMGTKESGSEGHTASGETVVWAGGDNPQTMLSPVVDMVANRAELQWLSPDVIEPHPFQPRTPEEQSMVESLRESIASCGQIVPAVVRKMDATANKPYRLIEGHRRWEAVRQLNRALLCYVVECTPHEEALFLLAANLNRQELRYLPLSHAMRQIVELGVSQKELSAAIGWDPAAVSRCLRLSRLPAATLDWLGKQQWSYRKINLAVETCLRQGREVGTLSPEDLQQGLMQSRQAQEKAGRNRVSLSIRLPPREKDIDQESYERKALQAYYAGCATGALELWKTVGAEREIHPERQLESVLYPAIAILREMAAATPLTPDLVWQKFLECWNHSLPDFSERTPVVKDTPGDVEVMEAASGTA